MIVIADHPSDVGSLPVSPVAALLGGYLMSRNADVDADWPTTDVWQRTAQCGPKGPYNVKPGNGDSRVLRENLNRAGCQCASGKHTDAHHIVEKGPRMQEAKNRLAQCGIGIDEALNGVCLPRNERIQSQAGSKVTPHQALLKESYRRTVTGRLNDAFDTGGCDAVKDELLEVADDLLNGQIPGA